MANFTDAFEIALRFAGWAFIPQWLTVASIPYIHKLILRRPEPPRGTLQYAQAYRWTYAFVILSYLAFNLIQAAHSHTPNYYELLRVNFDASEGQLKTAFRNFARRNHPDKVGDGGVDLFMKVRDAYESLKNPTKRFAYDRFGSAAFSFENAITEDEYVHTGLIQCTAFYTTTLFFMVVYGVLGDPDSGAMWRYILFGYLLFCELALCLQPFPLSFSLSDNQFPVQYAISSFPLPIIVLRMVFPNWLPYQHVSFLRQVYVALSIAITRVLPVVWPEKDDEGIGMAATQACEPVVRKLAELVHQADNEVIRTLQIQLTAVQGVDNPSRPAGRGIGPFPNCETVKLIEKEMGNYFVDSQLQSHPMLRTMSRDVILQQRRAAAEGDAGNMSTSSDGTTVDVAIMSLSRDVSPSLVSPTDTMRHISSSLSPPQSPRSSRAVSLPPMASPARSLVSISPTRNNGSSSSPEPSFGRSPSRPFQMAA